MQESYHDILQVTTINIKIILVLQHQKDVLFYICILNVSVFITHWSHYNYCPEFTHTK